MPERSSQRARLLIELARAVTAGKDVQTVLDRGLSALRHLVEFDGGSIQLVEDGSLRIAAGSPRPTPEALSFRLPIGSGFGGWVVSTGLPLYSPDAVADLRASPGGLARATSGVRSYLGVPLILGGETIGVVQIDSRRVDAFDDDAQFSVLSFVPTIASGVQSALMSERRVELREAESLSVR